MLEFNKTQFLIPPKKLYYIFYLEKLILFLKGSRNPFVAEELERKRKKKG